VVGRALGCYCEESEAGVEGLGGGEGICVKSKEGMGVLCYIDGCGVCVFLKKSAVLYSLLLTAWSMCCLSCKFLDASV
jgi:hypothetical protein